MTADQVAKWKAALAVHHKAQRRQRGRRAQDASIAHVGPGMVRLLPERAQDRTKPRGKTS